jgi:hypothetical protein
MSSTMTPDEMISALRDYEEHLRTHVFGYKHRNKTPVKNLSGLQLIKFFVDKLERFDDPQNSHEEKCFPALKNAVLKLENFYHQYLSATAAQESTGGYDELVEMFLTTPRQMNTELTGKLQFNRLRIVPAHEMFNTPFSETSLRTAWSILVQRMQDLSFYLGKTKDNNFELNFSPKDQECHTPYIVVVSEFLDNVFSVISNEGKQFQDTWAASLAESRGEKKQFHPRQHRPQQHRPHDQRNFQHRGNPQHHNQQRAFQFPTREQIAFQQGVLHAQQMMLNMAL